MSKGATAELAFASARAGLLDVAFRAEQAVTRVVGAYLGRDAWSAAYLVENVVGPQSVNRRRQHLYEIMDREGWHEHFPYVGPVLERVFDQRNRLAHSEEHVQAVRDPPI